MQHCRAWIEKTEFLRCKRGTLLITHPDYMLDGGPRDAYARFLLRFQDDPGMWRSIPREVSSGWRRRAASHLEPAGEGSRIVGPAAAEGDISVGARAD